MIITEIDKFLSVLLNFQSIGGFTEPTNRLKHCKYVNDALQACVCAGRCVWVRFSLFFRNDTCRPLIPLRRLRPAAVGIRGLDKRTPVAPLSQAFLPKRCRTVKVFDSPKPEICHGSYGRNSTSKTSTRRTYCDRSKKAVHFQSAVHSMVPLSSCVYPLVRHARSFGLSRRRCSAP